MEEKDSLSRSDCRGPGANEAIACEEGWWQGRQSGQGQGQGTACGDHGRTSAPAAPARTGGPRGARRAVESQLDGTGTGKQPAAKGGLDSRKQGRLRPQDWQGTLVDYDKACAQLNSLSGAVVVPVADAEQADAPSQMFLGPGTKCSARLLWQVECRPHVSLPMANGLRPDQTDKELP